MGDRFSQERVPEKARRELLVLAEQWTQSAAEIHRRLSKGLVEFPAASRFKAEVLNEKAAMLIELLEHEES